MRALLADDFHFKGSLDEFFSADEAIRVFCNMDPILEGISIKTEYLEIMRWFLFISFNVQNLLVLFQRLIIWYLKTEK